MKNNTTNAPLLLIYGQGGHRREMQLLLQQLADENLSSQVCANQSSGSESSTISKLNLICMGSGKLNIADDCQLLAHYSIADIRDKTSRWRSLMNFIPANFRLLSYTIKAYRSGPLSGVISTGPGVAILPVILLRLLGVKSVFVETYCRFETRSKTGIIMSKIAHRFLVQNKSQLALYPKAEYCGRL